MKRVRYFLFRHKLVWIVLLCAMALLLFSASTTHAAQPPYICGTHNVQFGQNLFRISMLYNVTIQQMQAANGIADPNLIYAGTTLWVPCPIGTGGPEPIPPIYTCRVWHTVAQGQTLAQIEALYSVNRYIIAQANLITNLDVINAGQQLCIP